MTWFADYTLVRPLWLLALPMIAGFIFVLQRRHSEAGDWENVIDPVLMGAMRTLGRVDGAGSRAVRQLPLWATGLILIALAGPAMQWRDAQAFRNLDGVVFVIDVSKSMTEDAQWPAVVMMGRAGVSALGSKPAALVVYAGDAYVASALTTDSRQIGLTMTLLDNKTVPDKGSRPALALAKAAEILKDADIIAGNVILMSDGAGLGPDALQAAKMIAGMGGQLSVVHAPTTVSGATGTTQAQLQTLVSVGGGSVYGLGNANGLMDDLNNSAAKRLERQDYLLLFWADFGRYLLLLALIPVLGLFRRGSA
ncbi:MAG: VWA domain-containing protein [Hyphomicrobiales bacterium]|nr:VWA domain-containing protein [Hyphomicrobiales bacterium]